MSQPSRTTDRPLLLLGAHHVERAGAGAAQRRVEHHALPEASIPFVGRDAELAAIADLLGRGECRLVTITGPGGIGKTRLALQLAARCGEAFADGAVFVDLHPVQSEEGVVPAVAAAFGLPLTCGDEPESRLLQCLAGKSALVVLDNVEHLPGCAELLLKLLHAAPMIKLLVTSRRVLSVREEWVFPLDGLDLPGADDAEDMFETAAVRLFIAHARRVRHDFSFEAEREAVLRICRLASGMPLAIELAASWTRTLPCAAIADEIAGNLAFLESRVRNVPERHRSVRAAFDQSWAHLSAEERGALARLSVFRGGFTRDAAAPVAGASLGLLAGLVDQSLVRHASDGRYHIHELLRQYAEERLNEAPAAAEAARVAYGAHFARFLAERCELLGSGRQREVVAEIDAEIDNIRAAWPQILGSAGADMLRRGLLALGAYYRMHGPYQEGLALLRQAERHLRAAGGTPLAPAALAPLLVDIAQLLMRIGRHAQAEGLLQESSELFEEHGIAPPLGSATDPLIWLGARALVRGEYARAARYGEAARARAELYEHPGNRSAAWFVLSEAALHQGRYRAAHRYAVLSYTAAQHGHDSWQLSYSLNQLGKVACALGAYDEARRHFQHSYGLRAAFDDQAGMAYALYYLGTVAARLGEHEAAREHYRRGLALYRDVGDPGATAQLLGGLGAVEVAAGNFEAAAQHFREALGTAASIGYVAFLPLLLVEIAGLMFRLGNFALVVEVLVSLLRHPATPHQAGEAAQELLLRVEVQLGGEALAAAARSGQSTELSATCHQVLEELAVPLAPGQRFEPTGRLAAPLPSAPPSALPEPLTEREREVLELVAEGLSNQAIAERLILSLGTVKWYTGQIYAKLGVQTRTQAVVRARAVGLLA
jgi:predicted ATPase/DNA-binding CsgD family transcriptional regulator